MATAQRRRLRLSANPMDLEDPLLEDPMLDPMEEEEPMGYEPEEVEGGMYRAQVTRGRRVSGPKTKLMASQSMRRMESAVVELAENQASMARSIAGLAKAVLTKGDDSDDEDEGKEDKALRKGSGTHKAQARKGADVGSGFQPYGEGSDEGDPESQTSEESTMNEPGLQDPKGKSTVGKGGVKKDDASGNFGEKDSDVPGNREAGIDEKDKPAEEYLIQGGPGAGTGPVGKAVTEDLNKAVAGVLAEHGLIKKAVAPAPGNSAIETGEQPNMDDLFDQARGMSFGELNRIRVESGELPRTLI